MATEGATYRKIMLRVVAFLGFLLVLSSLDRVNVSFAALQMNKDLGFNAQRYGFGVGIFFVGYLLFQIPSVLLLKRIGARLWLFVIVTGWGVIATCMAFIQNAEQFYVLRLLLGAAEAGLGPGIIFCLSAWMPAAYRARALAGATLGIPISVIFGGPISGALLGIHSLDIPGWRWLFFLEGIPAVIFGIIALISFSDSPEEARWLTDAERAQIKTDLRADENFVESEPAKPGGVGTVFIHLGRILSNWRFWCCTAIWFAVATGGNAIVFWLPTAMKSLSGSSDLVIGVVSALPWIGFALGLIFNGWHSDRTGERFLHVGLAATFAAAGLAATTVLNAGLPALVCLVIAGIGLGGAFSTFWTIPPSFLGRASAEGIALINLCGNLSGLVIPVAIGWLLDKTGSVNVPLYLIASLLAVGAILLVPVALHQRRAEARA